MTQLRSARKKSKLTMQQVADYLKITIDEYDRIENHDVVWTPAVLEKLAMLYCVSVTKLLTHPPYKLIVHKYNKNMAPEIVNMKARLNYAFSKAIEETR